MIKSWRVKREHSIGAALGVGYLPPTDMTGWAHDFWFAFGGTSIVLKVWGSSPPKGWMQ